MSDNRPEILKKRDALIKDLEAAHADIMRLNRELRDVWEEIRRVAMERFENSKAAE